MERAVNEGTHIFDVLDAHSSHLVEYFEPIFGTNAPDFSNRLMRLLKHDLVGSNLLVLDRLEVLPQYRGQQVGLDVMRHMLRRFSAGAGAVAIKPFPLQFEVSPPGDDEMKWREELQLERLPKDKRLATSKLCDYYKKLGFIRLGRTPFMVRATTWPVPSAATV
ncbi:MAG: hypothetical protein ACREXW_16550 [Gammaproteobacteria bacterium]